MGTPWKTNMSPTKGTISIGNTSSNHQFSGDMFVSFGGCICNWSYFTLLITADFGLGLGLHPTSGGSLHDCSPQLVRDFVQIYLWETSNKVMVILLMEEILHQLM